VTGQKPSIRNPGQLVEREGDLFLLVDSKHIGLVVRLSVKYSVKLSMKYESKMMVILVYCIKYKYSTSTGALTC
jgi:hypothetical protein